MLDSGEKMVILEEVRVCITWFIYFLDLLWVRYNCAKFHNSRICVTDFRDGGLFVPSIREQPQKCPSWIGLSKVYLQYLLALNPKKTGLTKNASSKERVKLCFLMTFDIIIRTSFLKLSLKFLKLFRKSEDSLCQYQLFSAIIIKLLDFLTFPCYKEINDVSL